ncbi:hypothetical protein MM326_13880 [Alkalihalobacillus sp. LMS6]|jgi:DNA-directed RNA polymerase specialized sigma24 family protein|uniref:hypothetical protein n=1 Tax=Alkalihalobacillus sp. LMS6 TaxID=2924034 RepID=UPI0020D1D6E0|nr:hypothetical protein [Alkalihalobacillus sp. LMS6]UTR05192.1 hypothetical protein MM326_13880 [Alkalihalobacillus sp. LMS6]
MDIEKLINDKARTALKTANENDFEDLVIILRSWWRPKIRATANSLNTTANEVEALYEDELLKVFKIYDGNRNFVNLLTVSLKNARADFYRTSKRRNERYELSIDKPTDCGNSSVDIQSDYVLENEVIKEKEDQRELIFSLTDAKTTGIVRAFFETQPLPSTKKVNKTELAKSAGVNKRTVMRALEKMRENYNPEIHGTPFLSA